MDIQCPCCKEQFKASIDILSDTGNDQVTAIEITPQVGGFLTASEVADTIKHWDKTIGAAAKACGFAFSHSVITKIITNDIGAVKVFFLSVFKEQKPKQGSLLP